MGVTQEKQLNHLWKKVLEQLSLKSNQNGDSNSKIVWEYRLTPPLPTAWPLNPQSALYYYVYAEGFRISLMDAVVIGSPWARVEQTMGLFSNKSPQIVQLSPSVEEIGIQGVRPLAAEEADVGRLEGAVKRNFLSLAAFTDPDAGISQDLLLFYRHWKKYNGVIAGRLQLLHPAFFAVFA